MSLINSYTNWSPLKEVWLGDVYPASWYGHLDSEVRDVFQQITETTQTDLAIIQRKIEEFGVQVVRPYYHSINDYVGHDGHLRKPSITPRDNFLAHGHNLIYTPGHEAPWQLEFDRRRQNSTNCLIAEPRLKHLGSINGANSVRAGRDIYLDVMLSKTTNNYQQLIAEYQRFMSPIFRDYRVHLLNNGGHVDGCFAVIKPGLLITSLHFDDYERTFPGWQCIPVNSPEFRVHQHKTGPRHNGKFWASAGDPNQAFNNHVIQHALDWVGNYTETFFEVNCLVIDEKNVLMMGENDLVFRELERHGVTAHSLPFRTRSFWDGGLHCLTLDIHRQDSAVDVFPEREDKPLFLY